MFTRQPIRFTGLLIPAVTAGVILALVMSGAGSLSAEPVIAGQSGARSGAAPNTTVTLTAVADAYILSSTATTNYGTAPTLYVGSQSTSPTGRALSRADLVVTSDPLDMKRIASALRRKLAVHRV